MTMTILRYIFLPLTCALFFSVGACQQEQTIHSSEDEQSDGYGPVGNFCEEVCHEVCTETICATKDKEACEYLDPESCQSRSDCESLSPLDSLTCQAVCDMFGVPELYSCRSKDIDFCESLSPTQCGLRSDCKPLSLLCEYTSTEKGYLVKEANNLAFCIENCRKK